MPVRQYVARGAILRSLGFWPDLTPGAAPPPPTTVMLLGSSGPGGGSGVNASLTTAGKLYAVRRAYDTGGIPTSYSASSASGDFTAGRSSVWSAKPDIVAFGAGTLDSAFTAFLATVPGGTMPNGRQYLFYCNLWHEADGKVKQGLYTAAQFRTASSRMADLIAASGKTNIIPTVNTTGMPFSGNYNDTAHGFSSPEDFWVPGKHKVYLLDAYNLWGYSTDATTTNKYNGNPWSQMVARFAPAVTWFKANGVRWGIGEWNATECVNTSASDPGGLHSKASTLTAGLQSCYDNSCEVFAYWDQAFGSDHDLLLRRLHSSSAFQAAWDAALTQYGSA